MGKKPNSFKYKPSHNDLPQRRGKKSIMDYFMFRDGNYWYAVIAYKDGFLEYHPLMTLRKLHYEDYYAWVRIYKQIHRKSAFKYLGSGRLFTRKDGVPQDDEPQYADYLIFKNVIVYCLKRDWTRKPEEKEMPIRVRFKKSGPGIPSTPVYIEKPVIDWPTYWKGQERIAKPTMEDIANGEAAKRFKKLIPARGTKSLRMHLRLYHEIRKAYKSLCVEGAIDSSEDGRLRPHLFADYAQRLVANGKADPLMKKRPK